MFYSSQYGFHKMHSTVFAGLELTDRLGRDIDDKNVPLAAFMDLSKAFDTPNNEVLLKKLSWYNNHSALMVLNLS